MGPSNRLFSVIRLGLVLALCTAVIGAGISDKRMCADPKCSIPISTARTVTPYNSIDKDILSFTSNEEVVIYSKEAGTNRDLWGAQIGNRRGYIPKRLVREMKMHHKGPLNYEVPTETISEPEIDATNKEVPVSSPAIIEEVQNGVNNETVLDTGSEKVEVVPEVPLTKEETVKSEENPAEKVGVETDSIKKEPENVEKQSFSSESVTVEDEEDDDDYEDDEEEEGSEEEEDEEVEETPKEENVKKEEILKNKEEITENKEEPKIIDKPVDVVPVPVPGTLSLLQMNSKNPLPKPTEEPLPPYFAETESNSTETNGTETERESNPTQPASVLDPTTVPPSTNSEPQLDQVTELPGIGDKTENSNIEINSTDKNEEVIENTGSVLNETNSQQLDNNEGISTQDVVSETGPDSVSPQKSEDYSQNTVKPQLDIPNSDSNQILKEETVPINIDNSQTEQMEQPTVQELVNETETVNSQQNNLEGSESTVKPVTEQNPGFEENIPVEPQVLEQPIPEIVIEDKLSFVENDGVQEVTEKMNIDPIPPIENIDLTTEIPVLPSIPEVNEIDPVLPTHPPSIQYPPQPEVIPETINKEDISETLKEEYNPEVLNKEENTLHLGNEHLQEPHGFETPTTDSPVEIEIPKPETAEETGYAPETNEGPGFLEKAIDSVKNFVSGINFNFGSSKQEEIVDDEIDRILYPEKYANKKEEEQTIDEEYCEKVSPNSCPTKGSSGSGGGGAGMRHPMISHREPATKHSSSSPGGGRGSSIDYEEYLVLFLESVLSKTDLILYLSVSAATVLLFTVIYYCCATSGRDGSLITKLNLMERTLMSAQKQSQLLENELIDTKFKLTSIEDSSFGSNEMVMAIKRDLELSNQEKGELLATKADLEKELETAAEAALELNKMVSELLSNQHGSESIISSVELLQQQLNEQQETILSINALLAEKSRENSELMVELNELKTKFEDEVGGEKERLEALEQENEELRVQNQKLGEENRVKLEKIIKGKDTELKSMESKWSETRSKLSTSEARIEALEECIRSLDKIDNKNSEVNLAKVMNVASIKTNLLAAVKEKDQFAERLKAETQAKVLLEDHVKTTNEEVQRLKKEYNEMEKEKLEAQTKLGILQSYFKEKETQLQKELSIKEAQCMQQQGETTSTVEKIRMMQEEIQTLKSQNESLKNEIEIQDTAHKTQMKALENRNHESWLVSRQAERRLEELRSEASVLRQKLTSLAEGSGSGNVIDGMMPSLDPGLNGVNPSANSPIHMDNPGSPIMPPLPSFLPPPPFMPPPPPHGFMPPPPFEMRPPPLGRLMSPPPPNGRHHQDHRYSPLMMDRGGARYSPNNRRDGGRYSPDSRYDNFSPYETETDISPPPSPPHHHQHSRHSSNSYGSNKNSTSNANPSRGQKKYKGKSYDSYSDENSDDFERFS